MKIIDGNVILAKTMKYENIMYALGLIVALIICFWRLIFAFMRLNSKMSKNLGLVGRRLSYLTLTPKQMTLKNKDESIFFKVLKFLAIWVLIPCFFIFFSWAYVAYLVGIHIYQYLQNNGMPNEIKEYRWKLNNLDLTFDQMTELMFKQANQNEFSLEEFKEHIRSELI